MSKSKKPTSNANKARAKNTGAPVNQQPYYGPNVVSLFGPRERIQYVTDVIPMSAIEDIPESSFMVSLEDAIEFNTTAVLPVIPNEPSYGKQFDPALIVTLRSDPQYNVDHDSIASSFAVGHLVDAMEESGLARLHRGCFVFTTTTGNRRGTGSCIAFKVIGDLQDAIHTLTNKIEVMGLTQCSSVLHSPFYFIKDKTSAIPLSPYCIYPTRGYEADWPMELVEAMMEEFLHASDHRWH